MPRLNLCNIELLRDYICLPPFSLKKNVDFIFLPPTQADVRSVTPLFLHTHTKVMSAHHRMPFICNFLSCMTSLPPFFG